MSREKKWDKVFNALVKLSQNLHNDRRFLEDKVKSMQDVIYKMKMKQKFESLKAELFLGMKEKDAVIYKHRYENTKDELGDFREWFDYLLQKSHVSSDGSEGSRNKALQAEVRKLKNEIKNSKSEKNSEISALLDEKNFVWKQLESMEKDLTGKLEKKREEVHGLNQKLNKLVKSNETLRASFSKKESELAQKCKEISKLLEEIETLKARSVSTPSSVAPEAHESSSYAAVKKELGSLQVIEKAARVKPSAHKSSGGKAPRRRLTSGGGSRSSKRKRAHVITISD